MGTQGVHLLLLDSCNRYYTQLITCLTGYNRFCSQIRKYLSTVHKHFSPILARITGLLEKRARLQFTVVFTTVLSLYTQLFPISSIAQITKISLSVYLRPFF